MERLRALGLGALSPQVHETMRMPTSPFLIIMIYFVVKELYRTRVIGLS